MSNEHIADAVLDQDGNPIGGGGGPDEYIFKSADESVASSTALQDDDELKFAIGADEMWTVRLVLYFTGAAPEVPGNQAGIKYTVDLSAGTGDVERYSTIDDVTVRDFGVVTEVVTDPAIRVVELTATLDNTGGGVAEFRLRWAQREANVTPVTVKKGSMLMAWLQP